MIDSPPAIASLGVKVKVKSPLAERREPPAARDRRLLVRPEFTRPSALKPSVVTVTALADCSAVGFLRTK